MCLLQHNLKCSGSVASPEVKGETDFLLVVFPSPLFFFFFTPFSCYLNFQTSALMSFVGTSRGLLAHGQVLVLVSRRESRILPGEPVGPAHSSLACPGAAQAALIPIPGAGAPTPPPPGPWACGARLVSVGWCVCTRTFSRLLKACPKGSVFRQSG